MKKKKIDLRPGVTRHPLHPEKKLVTRRDFLASGLISGAAAVMLPNIFDLALIEKVARADGPAAPMIPFLVFDCAGGAALPGNWLVTDREGMYKEADLLPSYSKLGLGDTNQFKVDARFGVPMAAPLDLNPNLFSQIFAMLSDPMMLDQSIQDNLRMGIICHTSLSDSGTNALSAVSLVTAAGVQGSRIKNGLGTRQGPSAGNSQAASLNPAYRPMGVGSVDSLTTALSYGPAFNGLPTRLKDALAVALSKLTNSQAQNLMQMRLGEQLASLADGAFKKNMEYTSDVGGIDARQDATVAGIYGINAGSQANNGDVVVATLVKNAIEGNSGPAVITIGGCDYHSGNRTDGDNKDSDIANQLIRALKVAAAKGKPVAFQIFTDGGIYSDDGTRNWRGDDNDKSLTIFGIYDPKGPHEMVATQLSSYTAGQGADRAHFLGTDPVRVAHTVLLNYLNVNGQGSRYADVAINDPLPANRLDGLQLFANKKA